jgi:hypothetical protein
VVNLVVGIPDFSRVLQRAANTTIRKMQYIKIHPRPTADMTIHINKWQIHCYCTKTNKKQTTDCPSYSNVAFECKQQSTYVFLTLLDIPNDVLVGVQHGLAVVGDVVLLAQSLHLGSNLVQIVARHRWEAAAHNTTTFRNLSHCTAYFFPCILFRCLKYYMHVDRNPFKI